MPVQHSLKVLNDWRDLKAVCKKFAKAHEDAIIILNSENYQISFAERFNKYDFFFNISSPDSDATMHETNVMISMFPINGISKQPSTFQNTASNILGFLNSWISLVREYYEHLPEKIQEEEWTESFFDDFKIHKDDADTASFDNDQQKYLLNILDAIESA